MKFGWLYIGLLITSSVCAQSNEVSRFSFPRWGPSVRGGSVYSFDTDMDEGGSFSMNRYFIEAGVARMWSLDRMVSVSAGYGQDDYNFSNLADDPWNNIDNYRLGAFARWRLDERWVLFAAPSIRSYGEPDADFDDTLTSSFFGGASYRVNERLTIGPGVVIAEQLEDDTRYFPVVLVNWSITDRLSLETGGGLAATAGPGLSMAYQFSDHWKGSLAVRYETKRFRLEDDNNLAPGGIGEDEKIPIAAGLSYYFYPKGYIGAIFGVNFGGEIRLEDGRGVKIRETDYDQTPFVGFVSSFRF